MCFVGGLEGADDLDKFHDGDGVHEVHADDLMSTVRNHAANLRDRDGRGIRCEDRMGRRLIRETLENGLLDIEVFTGRLNHKIHVLQTTRIFVEANARKHRIHRNLVHLSLRNRLVRPVPHKDLTILTRSHTRVDKFHLKTCNVTAHYPDTSTHLTGPNDRQLSHLIKLHLLI